MSLDLTKYRLSNHERIAVGGSYTDSFLEVMAKSKNSSNTFGYVRWVPNNKSGTASDYTAIFGNSVDTQYYNEWGYLQWVLDESAWHVFRFTYYDDTNTYDGSDTSPGLRLTGHNSFSNTQLDSLALLLTAIHEDSYGDQIYVLVNGSGIGSNTNLNNIMKSGGHSWRHAVSIGANTTVKEHTFCAIGTNIGDIGFLSENLAGPGSNHTAAFSELVIEHDKSTIGHAGYGEDLSSGFGSGTTKYDMADTTYNYQLNWNNDDRRRVTPGESIRLTFETRIGQGSRKYDGYINVAVDEYSATGNIASTSTSGDLQIVDGWAKGEIVHTKVSDSNPYCKFRIRAERGSGSGQGFDRLDLKNFQAFKCGYDPDLSRDVAVHKYHVNALNVEESPGPFRIGEPNEFYTFWNSDRNLAGNTATYSLSTTNTSTSSFPLRPVNYQYQNSSMPFGSNPWGDQQGFYNYPRWFNRIYQTAADSQTWGWTHESYNTTTNSTTNRVIGGTGTSVDHTKMYVAGVWMRVRRNSPTGNIYQPNRISLVGTTLHTAGYPEQNYGGGTSPNTLITSNQNYLQSISMNSYPNLTSTRQEWKLLNGFFLPSWMTGAERQDWKTNYWGLWANHFEHGEGSDPTKCSTGMSSYGIETHTAGYVCGMTTNTAKLYPIVRVEQHQSTDLWVEFVHPFIVEIDPMNINDEGNVYFWDFTENLPQ